MTYERRVRLIRIGMLYLGVASVAVVGVRLDLVKSDPPASAAMGPMDDAPAVAASPAADAAVPDAAADDAAAKAAADAYGDDLMNETYSATSDLAASLVEPAADFTANPNAPIVVSTVEGAGVELMLGKEIVSHRNLGKRTIDHKKGTTTYEYFGLHLKPGENVISVTALGKDNLRGETVSRSVWVGGPAVHVHGSIPAGTKLHADGKTQVPFTVVGTDARNHPAGDGSTVRLTVVSGDAGFIVPETNASPKPVATTQAGAPVPNVAPTPTGVARQVVVSFKNGAAEAMLVPGLVSGEVVVAVRSGDVEDDETYFVAPFIRKAFVNGIVTGGAGAVPGSIDGDGERDDGGSRRSRAAIYASGSLGSDTTATVAYETQNRLAPSSAYGPYIENPNERPYQSYGDTSSRRDDAISDDRLYGRLEHNRDSLTYGRVNVSTSSTDLPDGYTQLVSGLKLNLASGDGRSRLTAFESHNDLAFAREIFNATGLASVGQVAHGNIVIGSDVITLVAIDRHTGAVFSQQALTPNVDYTLDSVSGALHFINIPTPFDANLNPQVLLVTYQYYGVGNSGAKTVGGRGEIGFGGPGALKLGVGYINDTSGDGNFGLVNTDLVGRLPGGGTFALAYTQSNGVSPANTVAGLTPTGAGGTLGLALAGSDGRALQAKVRTRVLGSDFSASYDSTTIGFSNPFGSFTTPGFTDLQSSLHHHFGAGSDVTLSYSGQMNTGIGETSEQSTIALVGQKTFGRAVTFHAGLTHNQSGGSLAPIPTTTAVPATGATPLPVAQSLGSLADAGSVTQLVAGATWNLRPGLAFTADRTADISGTPSLTAPSQTTLGLSASLTKTVKAYIHESFSSSPYVSFANATSAYTAPVSGTRSTAIGLSEGLGPTLSADQELSLNHTASGEDVLISQGVHDHLQLGPHFSSDLSLQTSRGTEQVLQNAVSTTGTPVYGLTNDTNGYNAYGGSIGYSNDHNFRLAGGYQLRTGDGGGSTISFGGGGPIGTDVGVLGSMQKANGEGIESNDARLGLSFRPTDNDAGASLLEYERHDGLTYGSTREDILSFDQLYRPTHSLELAGRVAYKLDGNSDYAAHTTLFGFRATQRLGSTFDVATEANFLNAPGINGAAQTEFAVEAGVRVLDHIRLGLGYNFEGAADPTLLNAPTRKGIYVTFTSVVNRIFGWGR